MAEKKKKLDNVLPVDLSFPWLAAGSSFFGFGIGILVSGFYFIKKERMKLTVKEFGRPTAIASRAFVVGTMISTGTFTALSLLFMGVTGVRSAADFDRLMKKHGEGIIPPSKDADDHDNTEWSWEIYDDRQDKSSIWSFIVKDKPSQPLEIVPPIELEEPKSTE